MTALLLDEMIPAKVAQQLRANGIDAAALVERRDLLGYPDEALLELTTLEGRALVTKNVRDFVRLSQRWAAEARAHTGLVMLSTKTFSEPQDWVSAVAAALQAANEEGRLPQPGEVTWLPRAAAP